MKLIKLLLAGCLITATANAQTKEVILSTDTSKMDSVKYAKVFTKLEHPAEFPGGLAGWTKYLEMNLTYPKKALKKNIQGLVKVQFKVDKEGNVSEVMAINDPGGGLAEEAVRIIKEGPKWKPAEQNGKKVIYRHVQNITFALQ